MNWKKLTPVLLVCAGSLFIGLGAGLGWGLFPDLVKDQVEKNIDLTDTSSEGYKNFITPPVDVLMKITFFEVTNQDEVTQMKEKPKFIEKGPYTYKEVREKRNLTTDTDKGWIQFAQYRKFEFSPENSGEGLSKDDQVTILNMPLLGGVAAALEQGSLLGPIVLRKIAAEIDATATSKDLFMTDTVDRILFSGVDNSLVNFLKTDGALKNRLPPAIGDNGFSIFGIKDDTTENECYRVYLDVDRHTMIDMWGSDLDNLVDNLTSTRTCFAELSDGSNSPANCRSNKPWWPWADINGHDYHDTDFTTYCSEIRGTNGEQFPPYLNERKDEPLDIFTTDLCRTITLKYLEEDKIDGIKILRYTVPEDDGFVNKTKNVCFCEELGELAADNDTCIVKIDGSDELNIEACNLQSCHDGLQNIEKCMLSPVVMCSPHFYMAEAQLDNFAEDSGLNPVYEDHRTVLEIEPLTGMTLSVHKRIQVNQPLPPLPEGFDQIEFLVGRDNIPAFPIFWLDEGADIDQENIDKVKSMVTTPLILLDAAKYGMIALGGALFLGAAVVFFAC